MASKEGSAFFDVAQHHRICVCRLCVVVALFPRAMPSLHVDVAKNLTCMVNADLTHRMHRLVRSDLALQAQFEISLQHSIGHQMVDFVEWIVGCKILLSRSRSNLTTTRSSWYLAGFNKDQVVAHPDLVTPLG